MSKHSNPGRHGVLPWLLLIAALIATDQLTKIVVVRNLAYGDRMPVVPGWFDFTLLFNKGAAFSFLATGTGWQRWFFTAIGIAAAVLIIFLLVRHAGQRVFCAALALIAAGALGNVVDRVVRGHVVDFLLFYRGTWSFPAFNIADSAITVGAALLILDELLRVRRTR